MWMKSLAIAVSLLVAASIATADTNWTGATSSEFGIAGNWSSGLPVTGGQNWANIGTTAYPTVTANVNSSYLVTGGGLRLGNNSGTSATLNIHSDFSIGNICVAFVANSSGAVYQDSNSTVTWNNGGYANSFVGCAAGSTGLWQITGGTLNLQVGAAHYQVGGGASGTLNIYDGSVKIQRSATNNNKMFRIMGTGTVTMGNSGYSNRPYLGIDTSSSGTYSMSLNMPAGSKLQGWGDVYFDQAQTNNYGLVGTVTANGWGTDRDMYFNVNKSFTSSNGVPNGAAWYATNHGELKMPTINIAAGSTTVFWGEDGTTAQDAINSVKMVFSNSAAGSLNMSLLASDRSIFTGYTGPAYVSAYSTAFTGTTVDSGNTMGLTFVLPAAAISDPSTVKLWAFDGSSFSEIASSYDNATKVLTAGGLTSSSQYLLVTDGAGIPTVPEPATMAMLALGGLGVLIRRKR